MAGRGQAAGMRDGYLRGTLSPRATQRQMDVLAAYVAAGGSVHAAAELVGIRPSTVKRHLADLRARSGLSTEQLIYAGRASGWLVVPSLEKLTTQGGTSDLGAIVSAMTENEDAQVVDGVVATFRSRTAPESGVSDAASPAPIPGRRPSLTPASTPS